MTPSSPPHIHAGVVDLEVDAPRAVDEHMILVPVEVVDGLVLDPALPDNMSLGISSFSLSPSINLFTNCFNILGMDWVEKLKNLTINAQTLVVSTPIFDVPLDESPLDLGLVLTEEEVKSPPSPSESSE